MSNFWIALVLQMENPWVTWFICFSIGYSFLYYNTIYFWLIWIGVPVFIGLYLTSLKEIHGDLCWEKIGISSHVYLIICYCFLSMLNFAELAANDELFNIFKPFFYIVSINNAVARFSVCSFMSVFSSVPTTHM